MNSITEPKTSLKKKPGLAAGWSTGRVISADGTVIGYRQIGNGPGLVMLHGGGRASQHYARLAEALADGLTIYIPDRRGRGLSDPPGDNYSVQKELEDVSALVEKTASPYLFGHSAGGFFALEAALKLPVDKLAVYEPAVSINGSLPLGWLPAFEQALDQHDPAKAFVIFLKGLRLNRITELPDWFLYPLTKIVSVHRGEGGGKS
jgi:pimeloyl-ACP methyl ester carboxylesterase